MIKNKKTVIIICIVAALVLGAVGAGVGLGDTVGWGVAVGAIAPVYRYFLFGMPPIFPTGFAMCFELAVYGLVSGWLYRHLPEKKGSVYAALVAAMVSGRIVWGLVMMMVAAGGAAEFTWAVFLSGALLNAIPGIVLQLVLIPALVLVLKKAGVLRR